MLKINIFAALALTTSIYPLYAAEERTRDKVWKATQTVTVNALQFCVDHPARAVAVAAVLAALVKPETAPYGAGVTLAAYEIELFCSKYHAQKLQVENTALRLRANQIRDFLNPQK